MHDYNYKMGLYIALLRGINVTGHNKIKMTDLIISLSSLGFNNTQTYLQSGNVIFESDISDINYLKNQIEDRIKSDFGYDIYVLVLNKKTFIKIYNNNPMIGDSNLDIKKLYTIFLDKNPDKELFDDIKNNNEYPEEMILYDDIIYMHYINGNGKSKVNNNFFERKLKVKATTRNWNTVSNLVEKLEAY